MRRREFLLAAMTAQAQPRRPNLVFILADDLGSADLSCYGATDIRTPHIDSIARDGVRFTRFYASAPECSPTRTALLTGRWCQRVGGMECAIGVGNVGRYDEAEWLASRHDLGLPADGATLPALLKNAGYDTGLFGKWHLGYEEKFLPPRHGFDESFGILGGNADYFRHTEEDGRNVLYENGRPAKTEGYLTDVFAERAIAWAKKPRRNPFFLYLPFTAPHLPAQAPDGGGKEIKDRATYAKMVERMDQRVGDVLAALPENTLIVFTSDNGGFNLSSNGNLRGGKSSCWEGGVRAVCVAKWPGVIRPGTTTDQVGVTMDWTATLVAAAAARPPRQAFDGQDLRPVLRGGKWDRPRTLFWRYKRANTRRKAILDGDWKLVVDGGVESLHDLANDEGERRNLLESEPARAAELRRKLEAWEKETRAPRLGGFTPSQD